MDCSERIDFFLELMSCSQNISYWCVDVKERRISRTTSLYDGDRSFIRLTFGDEKRFEALRAFGETNRNPVISHNAVDLAWATVFEYEDNAVSKLHILGPLYTSEISPVVIEKELDRHYMSQRFRRRAIALLAGQPVLSATRFWPYVQMLHFAVNSEKVGIDAFRFEDFNAPKAKKRSVIPEEPETPNPQIHAGVFQTQVELFSKIERGDINYASALNNAVSKASFGTAVFGSPGEKANVYAIKFITLSTQAAIRGGLAPVIAYSVEDYYEMQVLNAKTLAEKKLVLDKMFDDYVHRVRKMKQRSNVSAPIRTCCDYISLHIYETIELDEMAKVIGYTKYYLSRKFKQEMGISIWDYINERKVDEAKLLLSDPRLTIQDVSDKLNYCSRSYFSEVFKNCTGMWPSNYRTGELNM